MHRDQDFRFLGCKQSSLYFCIEPEKKNMNKWCSMFVACMSLLIYTADLSAQCSICTKTAQQLSKASAEGLNSGIIYLMLAPFAVAGYIGFRWWKQEKSVSGE